MGFSLIIIIDNGPLRKHYFGKQINLSMFDARSIHPLQIIRAESLDYCFNIRLTT